MYNASKLTGPSLDFINYLVASNIGKCQVTTVAIAYAIAKQLQLPSSKIENVEGFYKQTHSITVMQKISQLNEFVIVDINDLSDTVRKFYLARYYIINPPNLCWCPSPETAVVDLFSISLGVDQATLEVIQREPIKLSKIHNAAMKFFEDMGGNTDTSEPPLHTR